MFDPVNDEPERSAQRALAGSDVLLLSAVGPEADLFAVSCEELTAADYH